MTLPLNDHFVAKSNVVESNVLNKQLKFVNNDLCVVIRSHTFSPVAVKQSVRNAVSVISLLSSKKRYTSQKPGIYFQPLPPPRTFVQLSLSQCTF